MLVISRKANEQIRIGDEIKIRVLGIVGSTVRLGIDAPRTIAIYREEIWTAIQEQNIRTAQEAPHQLPSFPSSLPKV
jgi:carbon storage regulator